MDKHEWEQRSEHSGLAWWPFALMFILFLFFWGRHGLWFFAWPLFLVIPALLFWGVASWFRSAYDAPYERRDENLDDLFFNDPWEKPKRDDAGEKPKRGGDSDIYYV